MRTEEQTSATGCGKVIISESSGFFLWTSFCSSILSILCCPFPGHVQTSSVWLLICAAPVPGALHSGSTQREPPHLPLCLLKLCFLSLLSVSVSGPTIIAGLITIENPMGINPLRGRLKGAPRSRSGGQKQTAKKSKHSRWSSSREGEL